MKLLSDRPHVCGNDCGPLSERDCPKCGKGQHRWSKIWWVHDTTGTIGCPA